tara:strand:- start:3111 stop:3686 length:576 start_codon:yes stop_codon:yes gene_type:complete
MSLLNWAAPFDPQPTHNKKNKTIKNRPSNSSENVKLDNKKLHKMLNSNNDTDSDSESDSGLGDFTPPPKAELTKIPDDVDIHNSLPPPPSQISSNINVSNPQNTPSKDFGQFSDEFKKHYNHNVSHPFAVYNDDTNDLSNRLNYLIQLLEEQKDEKTQNVTEELILYCFLGIFVIFIVDSFVKVGKSKYTR